LLLSLKGVAGLREIVFVLYGGGTILLRTIVGVIPKIKIDVGEDKLARGYGWDVYVK
jgi:hypothetical protein